MKINKFTLLAAAAASAIGSGASAQALFDAASVNGAGASLPQNVLRQAGDCYGIQNPLGFGVSSGTPQAALTLFDWEFNTPAADTIGNRFNCSGNAAAGLTVSPNFGGPRIVQPNVTVRYLSTGSGQGVTSYLNNRVSSNFVANDFRGAGTTSVYTSEEGYQYGASETALSAANLAVYNNTGVSTTNGQPIVTTINPFSRYSTADSAANLFGAPIQVPFVIGIVAVAYHPVYAKVRTTNTPTGLFEYRFTVPGARADGSGGLRLTRAQYCGIFNGAIDNWNKLPATVVSKDPTDPDTFDVPIRLVGRSETSGTTSLFTRAMAAQCDNQSVNTGIGGTTNPTVPTNKFVNAENRLPYSGSVTVAGTAYTGTTLGTSTINSLSGAFFDKGTGALTIGTENAGLFTVANGNDGVAQATAFHPAPGANVSDRTQNGRIAYVSPEQTLPAILFSGANAFGLNTASLQVAGTGTIYAAPDAKQAGSAFAGVAPPQSKGAAGAYCNDPVACPLGYGNRNNPIDWVAGGSRTSSQANPVKGYPIIGSSNILLYTCYATEARRKAVVGFVASMMGKQPRDYNNQAVPLLFLADATNGLFARSGLAPLPAAYRTAITETFLKRSLQVGTVGNTATQLGVRNLWIQDKIPATNTTLALTTAGNSLCAGRPGA